MYWYSSGIIANVNWLKMGKLLIWSYSLSVSIKEYLLQWNSKWEFLVLQNGIVSEFLPLPETLQALIIYRQVVCFSFQTRSFYWSSARNLNLCGPSFHLLTYFPYFAFSFPVPCTFACWFLTCLIQFVVLSKSLRNKQADNLRDKNWTNE